MPGRTKGIRRSKQSRIDRYHTVTDKDPVTGTLPKNEEKVEETKVEEKKEE